MDFKSSIIVVIIIAAIGIPMLMGSIKNKKRKQQKLKTLAQLAKENQCVIADYELAVNYAIAMDKTQQWLFYLKERAETTRLEAIPLAAYKTCELNKVCNPQAGRENQTYVIDALELHFVPRKPSAEDVVLDIFSVEDNKQLNGELQSAQKWVKLINASLAK